jgi:hypothetical protein
MLREYSMREQVKDHISNLNDEELTKYVGHAQAGTYTPEASSFAMAELKRRGLALEATEVHKTDCASQIAAEQARVDQKATRGLGGVAKTFAFLMGLSLSVLGYWIVSAILESNGHNQKAKDFTRLGRTGALIMILAIILYFGRFRIFGVSS